MRRLPPLAAVKVFEAAARHENFTLAAAELGMTQAAVSYQIRLLEERLGVPLFLRSKRRVTLTDAGRRVAGPVSAALDGIAEAFSGLVDEDESVLSINTAQTFASTWLAPRLGSFQLERPELAVRVATDNVLIDFARDEADLAIRIGQGPWPGLRHHFLFHLHFTPICTPEFRDRHGLEAPEDVLRAPRLSQEDDWWKMWLEHAGLRAPEGRMPGIKLDSQVTEVQAVYAGHGIALLTPMFWRAELASGRLVQPFPLVACDRRAHWLLYPEHKRNRAKIRAFREWLLREVAKEAGNAPAPIFTPPEWLSDGNGESHPRPAEPAAPRAPA
ncbi:MAG TPA: transcriptional regulator GcvA [Allosphingosinicella sp.]|jgi:LysR family glycine cleavage system transcriptional activator|nr:transcriptional regulator GcvA [Allosphingosinicella sp.]